MKTEQQIAFALQQAESGAAIGKIGRKLGISEQTLSMEEALRPADAIGGT